MKIIKCSKCNYDNNEDARFCNYCGSKLLDNNNVQMQKSANPDGMNICPACGYCAGFVVCKYCNIPMIDCNCSDDQYTDMLLNKSLEAWKEEMRTKYVIGSPQYNPEAYTARQKIDDERKAKREEDVRKNFKVIPTSPYKPKCPTCQSPDIEKVGIGEKAVSGFFFGLFSNKIRKQYRCKNCGFMW